MITPLCRFTYANVFEAKANLSGKLKFSCGLMFPKTDTAAIEIIKKAIDDAIKQGIAKGTINAAQAQSRTFKYPLRDGDQYYAEANDDAARAARAAFQGMMFLSASSDNPIGVVDKYAQPIINPEEFYSGCWGHADIRFYPFNRGGGIGVGVGLQNVMKKKDDDRLDGRQDATSAFANVAEKPGESSDVPFD
jgi:hypothetical protein